jgi:hypothetical protein
MRVTRWVLLAFALLSLASPVNAQKGHSRSSGAGHSSHSGALKGRSLKGGSGSAHKGGHYSGGHSAVPHAPRIRAAPRPRATAKSSTPRAPRVSNTPRVTTQHAPRARIAKSPPAPGARTAKGRLARSESAKRSFEKQSGHAGGWKGHVVDHIVPLACGGSDSPSNMQWQTVEAGKAKDKIERRGCGKHR